MTAEPLRPNRLVIVSNRLPVVIEESESGAWSVRPGSGGLVTALAPVLRDRGGTWIGWPGNAADRGAPVDALLEQAASEAGYSLHPVALSEEEIRGFYHGFSNEILWPLFHDLQSHCVFEPSYWESYQAANARFAETIARYDGSADLIWVHDYHLMSVARTLRTLGVHVPKAFFLHIPFPPLDIFLKLPWRIQLLSHLLDYDLIGFQTQRDRKNFVQCIRALARDVTVAGHRQMTELHANARTVRVGVFPISIDFGEFARATADPAVAEQAWYVHEGLPESQIVLGIDRLDYTKGIPEKLRAFRTALHRYPELQRKVTLLQVVVPSRSRIGRYAELKTEIERLVSEINGEFTGPGWVPVHYLYRHLERHELLAYYRTAEVALVTPLKDGMNLVAKEYCACNLEENGVLILSEFAGAVGQLHPWSLVVNPHDREAVAAAIARAVTMPPEERRDRMRRLRQLVRRQDIYAWVDAFLRTAVNKRLRDYPLVEPYSYAEEILIDREPPVRRRRSGVRRQGVPA